jgi:DNA-damage-inducible protein D
LVEADRLTARGELTETESKFSGVLFDAGLDRDAVARVRSRGDEVLFGGNDTRTMKKKWGVPEKRPLADFAPEVAIRAKQLGAAITSHNVKANKLSGEDVVCEEHETNSDAVRSTVLSRGIVLEKLPPEEDIKKVERRHGAEAKKLTKPDKKAKKKAS